MCLESLWLRGKRYKLEQKLLVLVIYTQRGVFIANLACRPWPNVITGGKIECKPGTFNSKMAPSQ